jgi:hypothetical protein
MLQYFSDLFGRSELLSTAAQNLVNSFKENLEDDADLRQFCSEAEHQDLLCAWAQSFCNIDSNGNRLIDDDEFKEYVAKNYDSRLYSKKGSIEVQHAAVKHFKIAVRENEGDLDEHVGGLTFKLFVRMMCKLRREVNNSNDADFKLYEFLRKHNAKVLTSAPSPDNSDKLAKFIEKAAGKRPRFHPLFVFCFLSRQNLLCCDHPVHLCSLFTQNGEMTSRSISKSISMLTLPMARVICSTIIPSSSSLQSGLKSAISPEITLKNTV